MGSGERDPPVVPGGLLLGIVPPVIDYPLVAVRVRGMLRLRLRPRCTGSADVHLEVVGVRLGLRVRVGAAVRVCAVPPRISLNPQSGSSSPPSVH